MALLERKGHLNAGFIEDWFLRGGTIHKCQSNVIIPVAYLNNWGILYTLCNQCLERPVETFVFVRVLL